MIRYMHMHGIYGITGANETSLRQPPLAMETLATAAAAALARPATSYVELWPLAATLMSAWPPVRARVGG